MRTFAYRCVHFTKAEQLTHSSRLQCSIFFFVVLGGFFFFFSLPSITLPPSGVVHTPPSGPCVTTSEFHTKVGYKYSVTRIPALRLALHCSARQDLGGGQLGRRKEYLLGTIMLCYFAQIMGSRYPIYYRLAKISNQNNEMILHPALRPCPLYPVPARHPPCHPRMLPLW